MRLLCALTHFTTPQRQNSHFSIAPWPCHRCKREYFTLALYVRKRGNFLKLHVTCSTKTLLPVWMVCMYEIHTVRTFSSSAVYVWAKKAYVQHIPTTYTSFFKIPYKKDPQCNVINKTQHDLSPRRRTGYEERVFCPSIFAHLFYEESFIYVFPKIRIESMESNKVIPIKFQFIFYLRALLSLKSRLSTSNVTWDGRNK